MKYSRQTLERLKNNYQRFFDKEIEDEVFDEIDNLESRNEHVKAANLFSVYINLSVSNRHAVALDKDREFVKLLKEHNLVNFEEFDNYVIARKMIKSGLQNIESYTIKSLYYNEDFETVIDSNLDEDFEEYEI